MTNLSKALAPRSWRSEETHNLYAADRALNVSSDKCPLCTAESVKEYIHWRIIPNKYPYDATTSTHRMIVPKEHVVETGVSLEALQELKSLKMTDLNDEYAFIMEVLPKNKSIPGHFHLHLLVPKVCD